MSINNWGVRARRFIGNAGRTYRRVKRELESASAVAKKVARTIKTETERSSGEGPSSAITGQMDSKVLYRRRRAPRRVRNRARKRAKVYLYRQLRAHSSNTNLFTRHISDSSSVDTQGVFTVTSGYTWCGSGTVGSDRVGSIYETCQNIENTDPVSVAKDWYLLGMSTDYTLTNVSTGSIECDVYEFVIRKDFSWKDTSHISVYSFWKDILQEESKLPGATLAMSVNDLGVVPTDANKAMRNILIKSKQRFYIGVGNAVSFTKRTRFRRPVKYTSADFDISSSTGNIDVLQAKAGVTRGIFVIYKGLPTVANACGAATVAMANQTRYTIKQIDREDDKNAINF